MYSIVTVHILVPMLLSVTFNEIAILRVWISFRARDFVANWIRWLCPFPFVAVPVCCRFGFGRSSVWPFRFVAISVCGRLDFGCSGLWPVWPKNEWEHRLTALWTTPNVNAHSFLGIKHSVIRIVFLPYSCCKSYFYWKTLPCYRRSCNTCPHTDACHRTVDKAQAHITPICAINFCFTEEWHITRVVWKMETEDWFCKIFDIWQYPLIGLQMLTIELLS